ncbi:hypothetical protein E4T44_03230 [Aureobasidium sp. EXF-8845]|nr:hypothetical protein E4T44_03230 [Aureobasidium sp. EXF-8845]
MQTASPSVGSADMRPPPTKPSNVKKNRTSSVRSQTPSGQSSASSRSRPDLCFICTKEYNYVYSLVTCCQCKRKYHRGCHRGSIPRPQPIEWTCYRCTSDTIDNMKPAAKKRKLDSPAISAVTDRSRPASQESEPKDVPKIQKYDQLIGMALHDAPNRRLEVEEMYKWIIDNAPHYDLEDAGWKNAIWVALAVNKDFVHQDGGPKGLWTFRDGASARYRPRRQSMTLQSIAGASSQDFHDDHSRFMQGDNVSSSLAPEHGLVNDDFKPSGTPISQSSTKRSARIRNKTDSRLPLTIDDTIDMIDLTVDEDEKLPPVAGSHNHQKSTAGRTTISLLHENSEDVSEHNRRSSFLNFGEPTWMKRKSTTPTAHTKYPFTDAILEDATVDRQTIDRLSGTEKWKTASRHVTNLLGSPPRATGPNDRARTSILRSPEDRPRLMSLGFQLPGSTVLPSRESLGRGTSSAMNVSEPVLPDVDDASQTEELPQSVPDSTKVIEKFAIIEHDSKQGTPAPDDQSMLMDLGSPTKSPEHNDVGHVLPEPAQGSDETINHIESRRTLPSQEAAFRDSYLEESQLRTQLSLEPLLQEHLHQLPPRKQESITEAHITQEPITEKPLTEGAIEEQELAEKLPTKIYTDLAVQTDPPVASTLALGDITHISLEPRVAVQAAAAIVRRTVNSTTQTEYAPKQQEATQPQPVLPWDLPTKVQEETADSSLPKSKNLPLTEAQLEAQLEKKRLKILHELMYPPPQRTRPDGTNSLSNDGPEVPEAEDPDSFYFDHEAKMEEIRARPTRKQIFGKVHLSRVEGRDALTKLNKMVLGKQRLEKINMYKGYTEEQIAEQKRLNEPEGFYNNLEELLNLPPQVVPFIHEGQLAFRDYVPAPNGSRRVPRAKHIFKTGPNARW